MPFLYDYRKSFNIKSDENVRFCMDMFICDHVDTMLMKRLMVMNTLDNFLCQITVSCNCN